MSSHSRVKGKVKKSSASGARSSATKSPSRQRTNASTTPQVPAEVGPGDENHAAVGADTKRDDFTLSSSDIAAVVSAAVDALPKGAKKHKASIQTRVDDILNGIHPTLGVDADRVTQCEQHLVSSLVIALQPFHARD